MKWRYSDFDPRRHGREKRFRHLQAVFHFLLVKTGGEVEDALEWLERLGEHYEWFDESYGPEDFKADLLRQGEVKESDGGTGAGLSLTRRGEKMLRKEALERVFTHLETGSGGQHRTPRTGAGGEELNETRAYTPGDPLERIAWTQSFRNAIARHSRSGLPGLSLSEDDLEVRESEAQVGCATVLLVDVSHSMVLYGEDRMLPAREVALALLELITTRYRKDTLDLVLFGDEAVHVPLEKIPYIQAGPFHTNTKAGLQMAQGILEGRRHVNKQIFMITDGKPSCIWREGRLYKNPFGLDEEVRNRTLDEALRCRRAGISVTTFMVAKDPLLVAFIEEFTELNRGRAYFTGTDGLSTALFVDYMRNRRATL